MKKPMYRDLLVIVGLVVIVAGAVLIYKKKSPLSVAVCDQGEYVIIEKKFTLREENEHYIVNADVPLPQSSQLEMYIRKIVSDRINEFKNGIITDTQEQPGDEYSVDIRDGRPADIDLSGELITSTSFVNYKLHDYTYTGGAHGMPYTETFVFSRANPTDRIHLEDLFVSKESFLPVIQSTVIPAILAQYKELYTSDSEYYTPEALTEALTQGTEWPDYFQNFTLTNEGITFIFSAYAITPYSEGEPEIMIPWNAIESILSDKMKELRKVCVQN